MTITLEDLARRLKDCLLIQANGPDGDSISSLDSVLPNSEKGPETNHGTAADKVAFQNLTAESAGQICSLITQACLDDDFVASNFTRQSGDDVRQILYQDPELEFCICSHVYDEPAIGKPHDHGPSWAVYGQAEGETEMSDWAIVKQEQGTRFVRKSRTYTMVRGDTQVYNVGSVHAPVREASVKLLRVEGTNLDNITRSTVKPLD